MTMIVAILRTLLWTIDSIAASLFVLNWLSWQIVSDDKIQIPILILRRGALSSGQYQRKVALTSIVIVCLKEEVEEQKTWFSQALEEQDPDQILGGSM